MTLPHPTIKIPLCLWSGLAPVGRWSAGPSMEQVLFFFFAALVLLSAATVILHKRIVYSALALIVCLGSLAALFVQLQAYFIASIQVIVYAGAIMVLFLFVILLVDPRSDAAQIRKGSATTWLAFPVVLLTTGALLWVIRDYHVSDEARGIVPASVAAEMGHTESLAQDLFTTYLLPFELTSVLILVAVLGAVALAKRRS